MTDQNGTKKTTICIGLPSKGRLRASAEKIFDDAGLKLVGNSGDRGYQGSINNKCNVDVWFMSAQEIAKSLKNNRIHIGITGYDLIEEGRDTGISENHYTEIVENLDFGHTSLVVAVPDCWIDVETMQDLDDVAYDFRKKTGRRIRVATKFVNCTHRFFGTHGVSDYRIIMNDGATEGAPATGNAEMIVDLSSSGETLRANQLRALNNGTILKSSAVIALSPPALRNSNINQEIFSLINELGIKNNHNNFSHK